MITKTYLTRRDDNYHNTLDTLYIACITQASFRFASGWVTMIYHDHLNVRNTLHAIYNDYHDVMYMTRLIYNDPHNVPDTTYMTPVTMHAETCRCQMLMAPMTAAVTRHMMLTMQQEAAEFCIPVGTMRK